MITRFRVEGTNSDKATLMSELQMAATELMEISGQPEYVEWECTDDFLCRTARGYRGRMVFVAREEGGA